MKMYDELVKRLRELPPEDFCDEWEFACACQQIMHEAADAIEKLTGRNVGKWIPVTERLPKGADKRWEICENVNLLMDDGLVTCGWMNGLTERVYYLNTRDDVIIKAPISRVTHWMPLPEPPSGTIEITYSNGEKYTACLADSYDNVMACLLDDDSVSVSHGIGKAEENK